jgi:hypothetical protein
MMHRVVARQKISGIVQHGHFRGNVSGTGAEVDERFPFASLIPGRDRGNTNFELQRGRDPVVRLEMVVFIVLTVRMEVDESGRNHHAADIHHVASFERRRRDSLNAFPTNSDIANRVKARLRVHHTPVGKHRVVGLPQERKRK